MTDVATIAWREADRWFRESREAAERCLPQLLALSGPELAVELERHAELQPGVTQLLLELVAGAVDIDPDRACELTAAVVHDAVATARRFYGEPAGNPWYVATAEVVAARILYDEGERTEALRRIGAADAAAYFEDARFAFAAAGSTRETLRARWGLAAAAILELLLLAGRDREALPLAGVVAERFRHAGLTLNALHAWVFVGRRAQGGRLTAADVAAVRVWFERLPLRPTPRIVAPERRA